MKSCFFTAEDIIEEEPSDDDEEDEDKADTVVTKTPKFIPVAFHQKCVDRIEKYLDRTLIKQTRTQYSSSDGSLSLICAVSKEHTKGGHRGYWFAFHPHQKEVLQNAQTAYIAFGCGSDELILLIPAQDFIQWVDGFNITKKEDRFYWHIIIIQHDSQLLLQPKSGFDSVDLTKYIMKKS